MIWKNINNALFGAMLAVTAVYFLIVGNDLSRVDWSNIQPIEVFLGAPFYGIMVVDWILIPIGIFVGLLIPALVKKKTRRGAVLYGLLSGLVVGLFFTVLVAYDFAAMTPVSGDNATRWWGRFWGEFGTAVLPAISYTSIWTVAYACLKAGEVKTLPIANQSQLNADSRVLDLR